MKTKPFAYDFVEAVRPIQGLKESSYTVPEGRAVPPSRKQAAIVACATFGISTI
jgi:hypothetical protein